MKRNQGDVVSVLGLLIICLFLLVLVSRIGWTNGVRDVLASITTPILTFVSGSQGVPHDSVAKLEEENRRLTKLLVDQEVLQKDNNALRDQFQTTTPKSTQLLPAQIIGQQTILATVSTPTVFVLDKGEKDGVKVDQAVVSKDMLVGRVKKTAGSTSIVELTTSPGFLLTGKTIKSGATGIVKGQGNGKIALENVVLSEELTVGDSVVTKGDISLSGDGTLPNLVIGKITSVEKQPSALFQKAEITPLGDFSTLSMIFIIVKNE